MMNVSHAQQNDGGAALPQPIPPIVALGASAGGVEAIREFLRELPGDTGMAFVLIQHLDPDRPSMLSDVLTHETSMPVLEVSNGMRPEPNRVFLNPGASDVGIEDGIFTLVPRTKVGHLHLPIDYFFRALAEDQPGRAIGVVLSGSASDGSDGVRAIKASGGITFAQEPKSAQFRSMPESALATGDVDYALPPAAIAHELARLGRHPFVSSKPPPAAEHNEDRALVELLAHVRRHTHLDFTRYKRPTIQRRVARRMALRRLDTLAEYAGAIREDPTEARVLAEDILIHVTSFFRDPDAFDSLKAHVFPDLVRQKTEGDVLRIWVPGCSTGEEAYSIVMCLLEFLELERRDVTLKVFGSDVSARAIEIARNAVYKASDLDGVGPERLARFFDRIDGGYRVAKHVRESCIFVKHDLTREPPFAKLDLVSCRNVLIYFGVELQRRVLAMLHHCLNTPGYLLLGESEGVNGLSDIFAVIDKENRIFQRTGESPRLTYSLSVGPEPERRTTSAMQMDRREPTREARQRAEHFLLSRYAPPAVIVDDQFNIVHFVGRTGDFLTPPPGRPQISVLKMAREGLVGQLHEALDAARATARPARKEGLQVDGDGRSKRLNLEVVPLPGAPAERPFFLVVFEDVAHELPRGDRRPSEAGREEPPTTAPDETRRLQAELRATRDYLQSLIAEHEGTSDELASANEELVAANEELQTTVEELESAKEELQSTNEELGTVNDELRSRNEDLDKVASDLVNVLDSVEIPIIIVDHALRIRRLTPIVSVVATSISTDVGRPIDDIKLKVAVDDLPGKIRTCIDTNTPQELEVPSLEGRWFRLRMRPYRRPDHRLDGAILSFVDVDALKRALREAERARDYASGIVETLPIPLLVLDGGLRVLSANRAYYETFATVPAHTEGRGLFELADGAWEVPALRATVEAGLATGAPFGPLDVERLLPRIGRKNFSISGLAIAPAVGAPSILLAIADVSQQRALESERTRLLASEKEARLEAQRANHAKDLFLATLSHELRNPLNTILMAAQLLKSTANTPEGTRASGAIERAAQSQAKLIGDLLDVSRIVSGKLLLDLQALDLANVVHAAADVARVSAEAKGLLLEVDVDSAIGSVFGDPVRLQQVVSNLLDNAIKFTPRGGRVTIRLARVDDRARLTVSDTGIGVAPDVLPQLFERFVQADSAMTRAHGGLGLGLAIVRHLVSVHSGDVHAESAGPGLGTTFVVNLPLVAPGTDIPRPPRTEPRVLAESVAGIRVLVIDDDDDTRQGLTAMLANLGVDVRGAASAADGLAAVPAFRPEVILCDIAMPGEDGYSFVRKLRSLGPEAGGQTPAAAVTALASEDDRREALSAGFDMHFAKPIDSTQIAVAIRSLAGRKPVRT